MTLLDYDQALRNEHKILTKTDSSYIVAARDMLVVILKPQAMYERGNVPTVWIRSLESCAARQSSREM